MPRLLRFFVIVCAWAKMFVIHSVYSIEQTNGNHIEELKLSDANLRKF